MICHVAFVWSLGVDRGGCIDPVSHNAVTWPLQAKTSIKCKEWKQSEFVMIIIYLVCKKGNVILYVQFVFLWSCSTHFGRAVHMSGNISVFILRFQ